MRDHYAFQCHLRDYASKGNLSFELRNLRVWQIKSFRLRSLVTDSRGSLSAVSTTLCQQVLESSFPSPVRKHALIGPVYLIQPIETCFISSRNQTCFTKICANYGEKRPWENTCTFTCSASMRKVRLGFTMWNIF